MRTRACSARRCRRRWTIGAGLVFVADPLDGTTNFLHGFPWYAVSIAAMVDGRARGRRGAQRRRTASCSRRRAAAARASTASRSPSRRSTDPMRALIGTGFPFKGGEHGRSSILRMLPRIMRESAGLRRPAPRRSISPTWRAGGSRRSGNQLAPWDIAAGMLLVREAGGVVTNLSGEPCRVDHTGVVAGNPAMHAWLLERVRG